MKTLPLSALGLIVVLAIVVSIPSVEGFSASGSKIIFDVEQGETAVHEWMLRNAIDETIGIEVYVAGPGSEFLTFEKLHILEPGEMINPEIFVTIPKDHPDNIAYKVELYALKRAPSLDEGVTGIMVNSQLKSFIEINIGENPIYTPPPAPVEAEIPDEPVIKAEPVVVEEGETPAPVVEETLEEKLARINAANKQVTTEKTIDDVWEEEAVPELAVDDSYIEEPTEALRPAPHQDEAQECDFIAWLLSLFGMAKC